VFVGCKNRYLHFVSGKIDLLDKENIRPPVMEIPRMSINKEIKRRIRDREKTDIFRFIRFWMLSLLACAPLILLWAFGKIALLVLVSILVFVPPITAVMALAIVKKGGSIAGSLYGGPRARWTVKEQLSGDLEKIQYSRRRFNEALALANDVLKHLPHDPDTLFLKAQILHEGFGYGESAKKCLEIIIKEVPASETLHCWATSLYENITSEQEMGQDPSLSGKG
jgi:hypothetical protein